MSINYFDKLKFSKTKVNTYNEGKIKHLDVTDAPQKIICDECKRKMVSRGKTIGKYYDAEVSQNGEWTFLYITYHHIRGYRCKHCKKDTSDLMQIPCGRHFSDELKHQIVQMLLLERPNKSITWEKLIEEYTIKDWDDTPTTNLSKKGKSKRLLNMERINTILNEYAEKISEQIRNYKILENVIFYPFLYTSKKRGALMSCSELEADTKSEVKLLISGIYDKYSNDSLQVALTNVSKDVQSIRKILVSPTLFSVRENIPGVAKEKYCILYEGIKSELEEIEDRILERKKEYDNDDIENLSEGFINATYPEEMPSFEEFTKKVNELFLKAEKKFRRYYAKLKTVYKGNEYYWFKNISLEKNKKMQKYIKEFDTVIGELEGTRISIRYLLAKEFEKLSYAFPPIQIYSDEMGSLEEPNSSKMAFSCGKASVTMQRPVSDELFILPVEKSYSVIVGFDDMSYCGYDILEGGSVELLIQHLDKLTIWEKAEMKTVYCRFDPELVYELRAIFQKAEVLVDLEEVVHAFAGDHIRTDEIQLIIATAVYVFDPDPASVGSRYPDWIAEHKPAFFEKSQPSPQKLLEIGYCTEEELDQLFQIYSRVSLAPELLEWYFTHNEIRKKYKEMEIFQSLAEQEVPAEDYAEKVKNEGLPTCIGTPKDLRFHRVLMAYEDVEIDLEGFLRCLDESDERPDIAPS